MKLVKSALKPIYQMLQRPSFRYSGYFVTAETLFNFLPYEKLAKTVMEFIAYSNLEGDYLEFGVFEGAHLTASYHFAKLNKLDSMRFFAFDSFQGLPEITGLDVSAPPQFKEGEFSCDAESFQRITARNGVARDSLKLIPGWFNETLNEATGRQLALEKAAVVWIDCDFYESTVPVLDFIADYVQDGTVLIFDDWFCFNGNPQYGQQRAFREWLLKNPSITASEYYKYSWSGMSFLLHKTK